MELLGLETFRHAPKCSRYFPGDSLLLRSSYENVKLYVQTQFAGKKTAEMKENELPRKWEDSSTAQASVQSEVKASYMRLIDSLKLSKCFPIGAGAPSLQVQIKFRHNATIVNVMFAVQEQFLTVFNHFSLSIYTHTRWRFDGIDQIKLKRISYVLMRQTEQ